ncbi:hypothetical protein GF361_00770 [Candidatus Woesearchaeota archaeon]|nr:hypothetical protein [Candidatus Woesearchaeota archaeon]
MVKQKGVAYIFGILSIVLAFFQPLPAIIIAIVGLVENKKEKSKTAKRLNVIGLVIAIVVLAITVGITVYLMQQGSANFPVY